MLVTCGGWSQSLGLRRVVAGQGRAVQGGWQYSTVVYSCLLQRPLLDPTVQSGLVRGQANPTPAHPTPPTPHRGLVLVIGPFNLSSPYPLFLFPWTRGPTASFTRFSRPHPGQTGRE